MLRQNPDVDASALQSRDQFRAQPGHPAIVGRVVEREEKHLLGCPSLGSAIRGCSQVGAGSWLGLDGAHDHGRSSSSVYERSCAAGAGALASAGRRKHRQCT